MVPLELIGVRVEVPANSPMLLLRERADPQRLLPIYIGSPEASAIHYALEGLDPPRPLTHDLFVDVLAALGATLTQVVVTDVRDRTFYAELHIEVGGQTSTVSARPSDAVALAVRVGAPILAADDLMDAEGRIPEPEVEAEAEIIDEFKDFLEHVDPEDFA